MYSPKRLVRSGPAACAIALASAIGLLGSAGLAAAQPCTLESVAERPGQWSEGPPDLAFARDVASPARQAAILKRIEPIAAMFREAYPEPRGTEAAGYASIRPGDERGARLVQEVLRQTLRIADVPVPYGYNSLYKPWLCPERTRQPSLAGETGNWAYVKVNSLASLLHDHGELEIDGRRVQELARRIGDLRGETLYEAWTGLSYGRALVFAHEGRYPWKPVSRKQYLDGMADHIQKTFAAQAAATDEAERAMEEQIAEIKRTMTGEMRERVVAEMERSLADVRARKPASDARMARNLDEELGYVRKYQASHSEQEMQQPAIVSSGGTGFRGFTEESTGGHLVVQVDPAYFRRDLAPEAAQLVVLLWRWEGASDENSGALYKASDAWHTTFERRFPIDRLRAMLDR